MYKCYHPQGNFRPFLHLLWVWGCPAILYLIIFFKNCFPIYTIGLQTSCRWEGSEPQRLGYCCWVFCYFQSEASGWRCPVLQNRGWNLRPEKAIPLPCVLSLSTNMSSQLCSHILLPGQLWPTPSPPARTPLILLTMGVLRPIQITVKVQHEQHMQLGGVGGVQKALAVKSCFWAREKERKRRERTMHRGKC